MMDERTRPTGFYWARKHPLGGQPSRWQVVEYDANFMEFYEAGLTAMTRTDFADVEDDPLTEPSK